MWIKIAGKWIRITESIKSHVVFGQPNSASCYSKTCFGPSEGAASLTNRFNGVATRVGAASVGIYTAYSYSYTNYIAPIMPGLENTTPEERIKMLAESMKAVVDLKTTGTIND